MELGQPAGDLEMDHFTCALYGKTRKHRLEVIPTEPVPQVYWTSGYKFNRVFIGRALYAFVEKDTGDIFSVSSDGETRNRTVCGNIHDRDRLNCCGPYSVTTRKKPLRKV